MPIVEHHPRWQLYSAFAYAIQNGQAPGTGGEVIVYGCGLINCGERRGGISGLTGLISFRAINAPSKTDRMMANQPIPRIKLSRVSKHAWGSQCLRCFASFFIYRRRSGCIPYLSMSLIYETGFGEKRLPLHVLHRSLENELETGAVDQTNKEAKKDV